MGLLEDEMEIVFDLHLLTNKKFVYGCNVSEEMMDSSETQLQKLI
jgi:ribosome-binding ATPase YchF (GTP1/OBG family)